MSQYNKTKGAIFETDVMKWLRKMGAKAERLTKAGAKDEGDIVVMANGKTYILELKATKALKLPEFWSEAVIEAKQAHSKAEENLANAEENLANARQEVINAKVTAEKLIKARETAQA